MRIWDVHPGYLSRQSLLGEHRELHGLYNILANGKRGYSRHPETLRWVGHLDALVIRHHLLAGEMHVRGYTDRTPLALSGPPSDASWPTVYLDTPWEQLSILKAKYGERTAGRIPLPKDIDEYVHQHRLSLMARFDSVPEWTGTPDAVSQELTAIMRTAPSEPGLFRIDAVLSDEIHRNAPPATAESDLPAWRAMNEGFTGK